MHILIATYCTCTVYLPKTDIFYDCGHAEKSGFGLIFDVGFFACRLMPFNVVYPRQVFERCLRC